LLLDLKKYIHKIMAQQPEVSEEDKNRKMNQETFREAMKIFEFVNNYRNDSSICEQYGIYAISIFDWKNDGYSHRSRFPRNGSQ
jgi:hypothetical protein